MATPKPRKSLDNLDIYTRSCPSSKSILLDSLDRFATNLSKTRCHNSLITNANFGFWTTLFFIYIFLYTVNYSNKKDLRRNYKTPWTTYSEKWLSFCTNQSVKNECLNYKYPKYIMYPLSLFLCFLYTPNHFSKTPQTCPKTHFFCHKANDSNNLYLGQV